MVDSDEEAPTIGGIAAEPRSVVMLFAPLEANAVRQAASGSSTLFQRRRNAMNGRRGEAPRIWLDTPP